MPQKIIIAMTIFLLLCGCRHTSTLFMKPPVNEPSTDATIKLTEAALSISDSMVEVAKVAKAIRPHNNDNTLTIPNTYALQKRASVDWSGPIDELALELSKAVHYRFRILGQEPALPVLVSVSVKDESIAETLRNIDYQAGKKASIHVYPDKKVIELRYAKFYS